MKRKTTFLISLFKYNDKVIEISLIDVIENKLTNYYKNNTIFQLEFSYCSNEIKVDIDSIERLNVNFIFKSITTELRYLEEYSGLS